MNYTDYLLEIEELEDMLLEPDTNKKFIKSEIKRTLKEAKKECSNEFNF